MDATMKPSPAQMLSPTTKSPFRGMPDRSSGFRNRTPSMLSADAEAADGDRNGFTAVEFKGEWEDELERRSQRRRESEDSEEGESPLGSGRFAAPPIPPPRSPRRQTASPPSQTGPTPPPRRQNANEPQQQQTAAQLLEAAVQRAAEVGAADMEALEEAEALEKSPTPPPRHVHYLCRRNSAESPASGDVDSEEGEESPLDKG